MDVFNYDESCGRHVEMINCVKAAINIARIVSISRKIFFSRGEFVSFVTICILLESNISCILLIIFKCSIFND